MNRRIVLYNPKAEYWTMPLALLSLASALDRSRYEPVIIDGRLENDPEEAVLGHCEEALCVGCTVLSGSPIIDALEVSRVVRSRYADTPLIWGGWHPSVLPETCLEEPSVDIAVQGQGEPVLNEVLDLCARSGLRRVVVGVEAATPEGLKFLRKDITLDQVRTSAERLARHGIAAKFSFIVGLPDEALSSVQAALGLAEELRSMAPVFETPFFFYQPYPGTELGAAIEARGHRVPVSLEEWAAFDYVGTAGPWVPEDVRRLVAPHTLSNTS